MLGSTSCHNDNFFFLGYGFVAAQYSAEVVLTLHYSGHDCGGELRISSHAQVTTDCQLVDLQTVHTGSDNQRRHFHHVPRRRRRLVWLYRLV